MVVLGGVGQLAGSVFAAFGLGIANKILEPQIGAVLGKILILALLLALPLLSLLPADSTLHVSAYTLTLVGKILCYAIVALALDLVWGYAGLLSLGHGLFFALGGYAMGMYLMRQALSLIHI